MNWEDTSELARDVMKELGDFSPTSHPANVEVKGYLHCDEGDDGRTYWTSDDLHRIAQGLSLIHISEPTRRHHVSRMPSSA